MAERPWKLNDSAPLTLAQEEEAAAAAGAWEPINDSAPTALATAFATATHQASVAFTATGTVAFDADLLGAASVAFTAVGTAAFDADLLAAASVAFTAVGTVAFDADLIAAASVAGTGVGIFDAAATQIHAVSVAFNATATFDAIAELIPAGPEIHQASVAFTASATFDASGTLQRAPELGAGSQRPAHAGMELYASQRAAESDRRRSRKPTADPVVVPIEVKPQAPIRRIVRLEAVDLAEHDRALEQFAIEVFQSVVPAAESAQVEAVEPIVPMYSDTSIDKVRARKQSVLDARARIARAREDALEAMRDRAQTGRDRQAHIAGMRSELFDALRQAEHDEQSPNVHAQLFASTQRQLDADDEELAMVLLLAA